MAANSAIQDQFGFILDATYGTYQAPTTFVDFVSEGMSFDVDRVESKAIRAGQKFMRSDDWTSGKKQGSGDLELELWNKNFVKIFRLMVGGSAVTVTGTGAASGTYTHTLTPGDLPSATFQYGITDVTGGVRPYSYLGCMVDNWELSASVDDPVKVKLSMVSKDFTTAQSLASASYPSGVELLTFVGASITVAGTSVPVNKVSIKGKNGLASDRFFLGTPTMSQPLEAEQRDVSGDFEAEFSDNTLFDLYRNGTEAAFVATFAGVTNSTHKVIVTMNVRFDGDTPSVDGYGITKNPMKFKAIATGADSTAITVAITTPDQS